MLAPRVATEREGRFTPVLRSRVLERIARAARYPIVVIAAPAGYGKTVALRQYLESVSAPVVRYDLRSSEATLLDFIRGFAHAFAEFAPDLAKTVVSAYESNHTSPHCAADLAQWMHAHIRDFGGLIAIDDLHIAQSEPRVDEFLSRLIDLTKEKTSWLLASRGIGALPVASWIAYGDMEFIIDERDLRMTLDEVQCVAHDLAPNLDEAQLKALLGATDAWPTALNFALRSSTNASDLREAASSSRELLYRYLAEQVYRSLEPKHVELLHFAAYLPEIDVSILSHAGYEMCEALFEELQARIGFIYRERPGVYRCHDLFREFLNYQIQKTGRDVVNRIRRRVAAAFEAAGRISTALEFYACIPAAADVVRLLRANWFGLLDEAHSNVIGMALDCIPDDGGTEEPVVLGLRGLREIVHGRFSRGEDLLRKAMNCASGASMRAEFALRLTNLLFTQGRRVLEFLDPLISDDALPEGARLRALTLAAPIYASEGRAADAIAAKDRIVKYAATCVPSAFTAQILHRAALTALSLSLPYDHVQDLFKTAIEISVKQGAYITASAALGGAATAALLYNDDLSTAVEFGERAVEVAIKGGNRLSLQLAILQLINIETWRGDVKRLEALEHQLLETSVEQSYGAFNDQTVAMLAALAGNVEQAFQILSRLDGSLFMDFDWCFQRTEIALYAVASGRPAYAIEIANKVFADLERVQDNRLHASVLAEMARAFAAISMALCGRPAAARRVLRKRPRFENAAVEAIRLCAKGFIQGALGAACTVDIQDGIRQLVAHDRAGIALLLERVAVPLLESGSREDALTSAEIAVLDALARGESPKEIALHSNRSVHTVRTLNQRAMQKLGCSSRQEAINLALRRGLIPPRV